MEQPQQWEHKEIKRGLAEVFRMGPDSTSCSVADNSY